MKLCVLINESEGPLHSKSPPPSQIWNSVIIPRTWSQFIPKSCAESFIKLAIRSIPRRSNNSSNHVSFEKQFVLHVFQFIKIILLATKKPRPAIFLSLFDLSCAALYPNKQMRGQGESSVFSISDTEWTTSSQKDICRGQCHNMWIRVLDHTHANRGQRGWGLFFSFLLV